MVFGTLFVAALAVACVPSAGAQDASPDAPAATARLLELVNRDRAQAGLHPLAARSDVASAATGWSDHMAASQVLAHNDAYFSADSRRRHDARSLGENVAFNASVDDAHARLMASPGHRANLLSDRFSVVGIGAVHDGSTWWITQSFVEPNAQAAAAPAQAPAPAPAPAPAAPAAPPAAAAPAAQGGAVAVSFTVVAPPAAAPADAPAADAPTSDAPEHAGTEHAVDVESGVALRTAAANSTSPVDLPALPVAIAIGALASLLVALAAWCRRAMLPTRRNTVRSLNSATSAAVMAA